MRRRASTFPLVAVVAVLAGGHCLASRPAMAGGVEAELEAGAAWATRNDVRIPGSTGTDLSLVDDLRSSATPVFRVRVGYRFGDRHLVTALVAPLRLNATGTAPSDVDFAGATFPAGTPLLAVYRFDSYRLTYRYSVLRSAGFDLAIGGTAKIRDAEISLHGAETARKTNTGFVPLLNVHVAWRPGGGPLGLLLNADALAAPQGRAEDVLVAATWTIRSDLGLYVGYRMLEGGADNDEVYNFSWFHYAVAGVQLQH